MRAIAFELAQIGSALHDGRDLDETLDAADLGREARAEAQADERHLAHADRLAHPARRQARIWSRQHREQRGIVGSPSESPSPG